MSRGQFVGSERKAAVRKLWCTRILESIFALLGRKYFYLGLPGPEILDILEWRDMIGRICAFERRAAGQDDEELYIDKMERNLATLGINFATYFGLIEEVMIYKKDIKGQIFEQDELVTLYQLDFCQAISSFTGTTLMNYRYEAIRGLLRHQGQLSPAGKNRPFVMFLTFRDEIHTQPLKDFSSELSNQTELDLVNQIHAQYPISSQKVMPKHPSLKPFVFGTLRSYFDGVNIRSIFLPPVHYNGNSAASPMVLYAVLACYEGLHKRVPTGLQTMEQYLTEQCFQLSDSGALSAIRKCGLEERSIGDPDAVIANKLSIFAADPVWENISDGPGRLGAG